MIAQTQLILYNPNSFAKHISKGGIKIAKRHSNKSPSFFHKSSNQRSEVPFMLPA